jgi:drug/metabolite transporter (DMT)-like permease
MYGRMHPLGAKGERVTLLLRGIFGFLGFALCYVAYRMIPLADASTIVFSAPVYVSVFACIILKEECGVFQSFTIGMTIIGVLLISKPTFLFGSDHESVVEVALRMEGTIIAFVSSLCAAATFVMMRRLQKTPSAVVISIFSVVSITMGILVLIVIRTFFREEAGMLAEGVGVPETTGEIMWVIANGLCGVFGQLCLTVSLKIEEAGLVSLARTIDIVMAFLFQVAFLHSEIVHWTSIVGAVIVCIGVCVSALRRWLRSKPGKYDTLWLILNCGIKRQEDEEVIKGKPDSYLSSSSSSDVVLDIKKIRITHEDDEKKGTPSV